jgi:hypothetical protein
LRISDSEICNQQVVGLNPSASSMIHSAFSRSRRSLERENAAPGNTAGNTFQALGAVLVLKRRAPGMGKSGKEASQALADEASARSADTTDQSRTPEAGAHEPARVNAQSDVERRASGGAGWTWAASARITVSM